MKLTKEMYQDAKSLGFKPKSHNLDGFAEACFKGNVYADIRGCRTDPADATDMAAWGLTEQEWRYEQVQAIELAMYLFEDAE